MSELGRLFMEVSRGRRLFHSGRWLTSARRMWTEVRPSEPAVRLVNYTDVYYNRRITADLDLTVEATRIRRTHRAIWGSTR